jgi:hypothetical protein
MHFFDSNKTAKLKVENSAQATSRLSPVTFYDPTLTPKISKLWHVFTIRTGTNVSTLDALRITQKYWTRLKIITNDNDARLFVRSANNEVKF